MKGIIRSLIGLFGGLVVCTAPAFAQKSRGPQPLPQDVPLVVCFQEGTDPAYVEAVNTLVALRNQVFTAGDYQAGSRWSGAIGTPRTLTWSFVPDGTAISGGAGEAQSGSTLFSTFDAQFAAQGGRATWILRFQQVFDRWHALTGITYTRITPGGNDWDDGAAWGSGSSATRGDIRISAHPIDGINNILAYTYFPSNGDMVFDSQENWGSSSNLNRFFRNTAAHEHGHGIGLNHVCPANNSKLMEPFLSTSYDGPRHDDMRAGQYLYGDPLETNDSSATATNLGNLASGSPINAGGAGSTTLPIPAPISGSSDTNSSILAIGAAGQVDWYKFTIATPLVGSVTATPQGRTYDSSTQNSQTGACNSGTIINSLTMGNLKVEVLSTNGTTVLGSSDTTAAGAAEILSNVPLSNPGTYFVRVSCSTITAGQSQLYTLQVVGSATSACPTFTQQPPDQIMCVGGSISFTCSAIGVPSPTYQWQKNHIPLANGGNVSGATTSTLTLDPVDFSDEADYTCIATNNCGSTASTDATLTMEDRPSVQTQLVGQSVPLNQPVTLTFVANYATGYQWRKNNVNIPGATSSTYQIASAQPSDAGTYTCSGYGDCGFVNSAAGVLTVVSCYANCDNSVTQPILNVQDFSCFLNRFASNDPYANCDNSTAQPVLNVQDFSCFLNLFAAGCS